MNSLDFQLFIQDQGQKLYRDMPWRSDTRPYYVLVSEIMLQQTQVERVIPKFLNFINTFPSEGDLAKADLSQVLICWQGLGYNRRAKFLQQAVQRIEIEFANKWPESKADLMRLPGVGPNTAGAIRAYAFNQPELFIETNIRTVYIHHFFPKYDTVTDKDIRPLLEETISQDRPREFYWALMDYGHHLKLQGIRNNAQSHHYKKQSKLEGSVRQIRGQILSVLAKESLSAAALEQQVTLDERFDVALSALLKEGLVTFDQGIFSLGE